MDVSQIRDYQIAIFSYKCFNRLLTPALENLFIFNRDHHDHNTKKADNLIHEFRSTTRPSFVIPIIVPMFGIYCPSVRKIHLVFRLSSYGQINFFCLVSEFDVKPAPGCHSIQCIFPIFFAVIFFFLYFPPSLFPFLPSSDEFLVC